MHDQLVSQIQWLQIQLQKSLDWPSNSIEKVAFQALTNQHHASSVGFID